MNELNGKYIRDEELDVFKQEVFNHMAFNSVLEAVTEYGVPLTTDDLQVQFAYMGDVINEDRETVTARQINFVNSSKTVLINFTTINGVALPIEAISFAHLVDQKENKHQLIAVRLDRNGKKYSEVLEDDYAENSLTIIEEELVDDTNYEPKTEPQSTADEISTQAWWLGNGCLPGGYQHCGANCGYSPRTHGGGSPINPTDRCCVLHDSCYEQGIRQCSCDNMLLSCVEIHSTWAAIGIKTYFSGC
ncbi:hypothetical protein [Alkalibacillus silvisoli]|uniref:Phospholipase A2 domain-containing protein n=1 Tax=Alkalibacillus silvisoli TaxID=392823 RepID=A0ABP3JTU1_9BACI